METRTLLPGEWATYRIEPAPWPEGWGADQGWQIVPTLPRPRGLAPRVVRAGPDAVLLCLVGIALALGVLAVIGAGVLVAWAWRVMTGLLGV